MLKFYGILLDLQECKFEARTKIKIKTEKRNLVTKRYKD